MALMVRKAESEPPPQHGEDAVGQALAGTKLQIAEAALETLRAMGFAGASAREIAKAGNFNQALIFYHFGSVQNALLAALDLVSARRMRAYEKRFEQARTVADLATLAREIYEEDLENGYVTVLVAMVVAGASSADLGREVVDRIEPWIDMVARKLHQLIAGSVFEPMVRERDAAFGIVALYLGMDMLSHLQGDNTRAGALLDLGASRAPLVDALLPSHGEGPA